MRKFLLPNYVDGNFYFCVSYTLHMFTFKLQRLWPLIPFYKCEEIYLTSFLTFIGLSTSYNFDTRKTSNLLFMYDPDLSLKASIRSSYCKFYIDTFHPYLLVVSHI
jgi:hypothetical protein